MSSWDPALSKVGYLSHLQTTFPQKVASYMHFMSCRLLFLNMPQSCLPECWQLGDQLSAQWDLKLSTDKHWTRLSLARSFSHLLWHDKHVADGMYVYTDLLSLRLCIIYLLDWLIRFMCCPNNFEGTLFIKRSCCFLPISVLRTNRHFLGDKIPADTQDDFVDLLVDSVIRIWLWLDAWVSSPSW